MEFTPEEAKILAPFFTNLDKNVFALKNLPEVVKGALFSRYSRTDKSLRRVLLEEFINKPEMGFREIVGFQLDSGQNEIIAIKKAEEFYDRILVGFGDDSVAELGGAHLACENVTNIATKVIEDSRIGLSPLEKSSRYVFFNEKINGNYRYYRDPVIMSSGFADLFVKICDLLFGIYSELIEPMKKFLAEKYPMEEGATERAYNFTIKAKACDILRLLLPAATLTNVGIFGNGRAFEYLLTKMYAHELVEMHDIAKAMQEELSKVIPSFVKRADDAYGKSMQSFFAESMIASRKFSEEFLNSYVEKQEPVTLVHYDRDAENKVIAAILYSQSKCPMEQIWKIVLSMPAEQKKIIIDGYISHRQNRRHRPGRAFENTFYTFDILANYGAYRDLQRHRMLTQERQDLTIEHGYDTPPELEQAGFADRYHNAMQQAAEAFAEISRRFPKQAQYVVPFGYKIRWYIAMNLREAYHLLELRTMRQGHPDYRKICQQMFLKIKEVHPVLAGHMKFVDMNTYSLERLESEKKLDKKLQEIARKYDER